MAAGEAEGVVVEGVGGEGGDWDEDDAFYGKNVLGSDCERDVLMNKIDA